LALPARKKDAALADNRVVALRKLHDEVVREGHARGLFNLSVGRVELAVSYVVSDSIVKEHSLLCDQSYLFAKTAYARIPQVRSVPNNSASRRVVKAREQFC